MNSILLIVIVNKKIITLYNMLENCLNCYCINILSLCIISFPAYWFNVAANLITDNTTRWRSGRLDIAYKRFTISVYWECIRCTCTWDYMSLIVRYNLSITQCQSLNWSRITITESSLKNDIIYSLGINKFDR